MWSSRTYMVCTKICFWRIYVRRLNKRRLSWNNANRSKIRRKLIIRGLRKIIKICRRLWIDIGKLCKDWLNTSSLQRKELVTVNTKNRHFPRIWAHLWTLALRKRDRSLELLWSRLEQIHQGLAVQAQSLRLQWVDIWTMIGSVASWICSSSWASRSPHSI